MSRERYARLLRQSPLKQLVMHALTLRNRLTRDRWWKSPPWQCAYHCWSLAVVPELRRRGWPFGAGAPILPARVADNPLWNLLEQSHATRET